MVCTGKTRMMQTLPDVLLHAILFQLNLPIELRTIIIEDYFPFLPNPGVPFEVHYLRTLCNIYCNVISKNSINTLVDIGVYCLELRVHEEIMIVRIVKCFFGHFMQICKRGDAPLDDSMKLYHPDISFTQPLLEDFNFHFQVVQLRNANVDSVHRAIMKWYNKIVYLSIYQKEEFGFH